MIQSHLGEFAALLTAIFWSVTGLSFEQAGKRIGSLTVNVMRLTLAFVIIGFYTLITRGMFIPADATAHQWFWLSLSGLVGFVLGDLFLFKAYVSVGARISLLIMSLAPPVAAFTGWLMMGETMSWMHLFGMSLTLLGIAIVVLQRRNGNQDTAAGNKKVKFSYPVSGLLFALGGAVGQGVGLVMSKYGMQQYDAFASTQIRIITGVIGFAFIYSMLGRWSQLKPALTDKIAMKYVLLGTTFGPFLGVAFSLLAVKYTSSGIASTIMSIMPVLIIVPSVFIYKEKVTFKEIIGACLAVVGVAIFFM